MTPDDFAVPILKALDILTGCGAGTIAIIAIAVLSILANVWLVKTIIAVILNSKKAIKNLLEGD